MNELKITSLDDIRQRSCPIVPLPGWGREEPFMAKLKQVSIFDLASKGQIPNALLGVASALINGESRPKGDVDLKSLADMINLLCEVSMVEPKYTEVADMLTDEQRLAIYDFSQYGVQALAPFREESEDIESNSNVQDIPSETEPDTEHTK